MKRSINTRSMNKLFVSLFVFILLILPNNVIAVDYIFEEDFSSGIGEWKFIGVNWEGYSGTSGAKVKNHSLSIQDGKLVSNRFINDTWNWDHAYHPTTLKNGVWQFRAQNDRYATLDNETSSPYADYHWQFELIFGDLDYDGVTESTDHSYIVLIQFLDNNGVDRITISEGYAQEVKDYRYRRSDNFTENGAYTYLIAKNEAAVSIYINGVKVVEHKLATASVIFNYFGIGTARPISVDDFKVTEDLSILPPESVESVESVESETDNSDNGFASTTNIVVATVAISFAALSYKYYFSKKKSLKI